MMRRLLSLGLVIGAMGVVGTGCNIITDFDRFEAAGDASVSEDARVEVDAAAACEGLDEGDLCDDGNRCTENDACRSGLCTGEPKECAAVECNDVACNPANGECEPSPADEGMDCNDGDRCTDPDMCVTGVCTGRDLRVGDTCANAQPLPNEVGAHRLEGSVGECNDDSTTATSCDSEIPDGGLDRVFSLTLDRPRYISLETLPPSESKGFDTVVYVRMNCANPDTEIGCDDDGAPTGSFSQLEGGLLPGTYFVFIDQYSDATATGDYVLELQIDPHNRCTSPVVLELPEPGMMVETSGSTVGGNNTFMSPAACGGGAPGTDRVYEITPKVDTMVEFETVRPASDQFDTVLHLRQNCVGTAAATLACDDNGGGSGAAGFSRLQYLLEAATTYHLIVDGRTATTAGNYRLVIRNMNPDTP